MPRAPGSEYISLFGAFCLVFAVGLVLDSLYFGTRDTKVFTRQLYVDDWYNYTSDWSYYQHHESLWMRDAAPLAFRFTYSMLSDKELCISVRSLLSVDETTIRAQRIINNNGSAANPHTMAPPYYYSTTSTTTAAATSTTSSSTTTSTTSAATTQPASNTLAPDSGLIKREVCVIPCFKELQLLIGSFNLSPKRNVCLKVNTTDESFLSLLPTRDIAVSEEADRTLESFMQQDIVMEAMILQLRLDWTSTRSSNAPIMTYDEARLLVLNYTAASTRGSYDLNSISTRMLRALKNAKLAWLCGKSSDEFAYWYGMTVICSLVRFLYYIFVVIAGTWILVLSESTSSAEMELRWKIIMWTSIAVYLGVTSAQLAATAQVRRFEERVICGSNQIEGKSLVDCGWSEVGVFLADFASGWILFKCGIILTIVLWDWACSGPTCYPATHHRAPPQMHETYAEELGAPLATTNRARPTVSPGATPTSTNVTPRRPAALQQRARGHSTREDRDFANLLVGGGGGGSVRINIAPVIRPLRLPVVVNGKPLQCPVCMDECRDVAELVHQDSAGAGGNLSQHKMCSDCRAKHAQSATADRCPWCRGQLVME